MYFIIIIRYIYNNTSYTNSNDIYKDHTVFYGNMRKNILKFLRKTNYFLQTT